MFPRSLIAKKLDGDDDRSFELMVRTWERALQGVTPERVAKALRTLLEGGGTFEPSMPEFLQLCKPEPAAHKTYRALTGNPGAPMPHEPASVKHYPKRVRKELKRIGMLPKPGETHREYCLRCRTYTREKYPHTRDLDRNTEASP